MMIVLRERQSILLKARPSTASASDFSHFPPWLFTIQMSREGIFPLSLKIGDKKMSLFSSNELEVAIHFVFSISIRKIKIQFNASAMCVWQTDASTRQYRNND